MIVIPLARSQDAAFPDSGNDRSMPSMVAHHVWPSVIIVPILVVQCGSFIVGAPIGKLTDRQ